MKKIGRKSGGKKTLLSALNGERTEKVPFWLMRQAGRYLPEYRDLRAQAGGFLDLVFNPGWAAEVTLQPIRRFGMHGAILFSDILVVPHALGQSVRFEAGEGPRLKPLDGDLDVLSFDRFDEILAPVCQTVRIVQEGLQALPDTALIGFAGAPWTVACYMVEGQGSKDFAVAKAFAYGDPAGFQRLIDRLIEATIRYLSAQIDAGAEAVQLFDSWSGLLDELHFRRWVIEPTRAIAAVLLANYPDIPLIGFPRGAGALYGAYAAEAGVTALGLDPQVPLAAARTLQETLPVQGNLDPVRLLAGGEALQHGIEDILDQLGHGPFVFNLGHGVIKETPVEHVGQLAAQINGWNFKTD